MFGVVFVMLSVIILEEETGKLAKFIEDKSESLPGIPGKIRQVRYISHTNKVWM